MRTFAGLWYCFLWEILNVVAIGNPMSTTSPSTNSSENPCDTKSKNLDKCWSQIPPVAGTGIPSSPEAVMAACKAFDVGMNCVEDWAKQCLGKEAQEKVKTSVSGAHETFTFLCRDQKFRKEFLKHAECYKRISHKWDDCAKKFIENLKRYSDVQDEPAICCVKIKFLQCVTDLAHYQCSQEAAIFLQRLAETLVRSTMRSHSQRCGNITHKNCSTVNSAPSTSCKSIFPFETNKNLAVDAFLLPVMSWDDIFRFAIVSINTVCLVLQTKWV